MAERQVMCVISEYRDRRVLAVLLDGVIEDILMSDDNDGLNVGDIVIGKVTDVVSSISSAFIDLGGEKGFISLKNGESLKPGAEIPVQITKEAAGSKEAAVTKKLSLAGKYAVVSLSEDRSPALHISKKIEDKAERERLDSLLGSLKTDHDVTIRTKAEHVSGEDISREIAELAAKLDDIIKRSGSRTPFSRLYSSDDPFISAVRDCRFGEVTRIVTDLPDIYDIMSENYPDIKTELYQDEMLKLIKLHKIESTIESVYERRVWLKSGGYLVIDRTEAMTVIDVNSGKASSKGSKAETFLEINLEAASELARQLRIRNLSGMILVDFINMKSREDHLALEERLKDALKYDQSNCCFIDFTKLGIAEIVRQKKRRPLIDILNGNKH
ncbi:MAG: ribonuclease E/G [Lachnospiraceae bacterium]|nr:ribonuclease E/G [Lachnospiraceae bacterium]